MGIKTAPPFHPHFIVLLLFTQPDVISSRGLCKDSLQANQNPPNARLEIVFPVGHLPVGNGNYVDSR